MKVLALIALLSACAYVEAKPGVIISSSSQYHAQDKLGQYSYGYSNPQSSKVEVKTADGITQGSYSYVDAEGKLQSVHYTADEINGFRVAATNLPTPILPLVAPIIRDESKMEMETGKILSEDKAETKNALHVPPTQVLRTSLMTYAAPVVAHIAAPGFGYSYGYGYPQYAYFNHLSPITYVAHIATPDLGTLTEPSDTPEVIKARAEHIKAYEQAKSANL